MSRSSSKPGIGAQIATFTFTRTVLNTGFRMIYPFLPTFARGLGISLETTALAATARSALGFLSPVLGSTADTRGRKAAMMLGLALFAAGGFVVGLWPRLTGFLIGVVLIGAGKIIFDPAIHAFLGDRVPYERRGLAIALAEMGWSGAFWIGVPLAGWLIARSTWWLPFPALGALAVLAGVLLWGILPDDRPAGHTARPSLREAIHTTMKHPAALAGLAVGMLISVANEVINIIFGAWLESSFGLAVAALGAATAVIGVAELAGEGLVALLADRLGKRRSVAIGIVLNMAASLALPLIGRTTVGALAGLFLLFISFEYALVSSIPLITELVPGARGTLLAANIAGLSAGRVAGTLIGPALFASGLLTNSLTAVVLDGLALAVLLIFVKLK
ncbi:MAG: MFS transporter [Anaerolineae bacterium]